MDAQDEKPAMDHIEKVEAQSKPRSSLGAKVKAHLRKWWWAHLIFFIASLLIIVLCVVYVGFPRKAQHDINASTLTVTALDLSRPSAKSFHLRQNATVGNKSQYHPQLDQFNASLSLDGGKPYAYIQLPKLHATKAAISLVDQDVQITDADAFASYTQAVLMQKEVKVRVKGRTGLHEMSLPTTHVDYDKVATLKGLNKLSGFNVTSFSIKLTPEPDGANMVGEISIPNPSVMTLAMGKVSFNNFLPATSSSPRIPIGVSNLNNLTLVPGDNTVPMRSIINQTLVIGAITKSFKDGNLPIEITGNSSVYNGEHLPYYEKALQGLTQTITLNVGAALKGAGVDLQSLASLAGGLLPP